LNWDQTVVYATTNYTYNVRDQITEINQAGQLRTFAYDGYGRLQTRTTPEQGPTNYTYFENGMTKTVTDARGATTTFTYNGRDLVASMSYGVPSGVAPTSTVSFSYDAAGNRTSMNDGLGSVSYVYNTLSQLTSETRTFTGVAGSFALTYGYNLSGELNSITNHGAHRSVMATTKSAGPLVCLVLVIRDSRVTLTASPTVPLVSSRWHINNNRTLSVQYDNRMRPTQWNIPGVMGWNLPVRILQREQWSPHVCAEHQ
jgi:YD repeat-containing protein